MEEVQVVRCANMPPQSCPRCGPSGCLCNNEDTDFDDFYAPTNRSSTAPTSSTTDLRAQPYSNLSAEATAPRQPYPGISSSNPAQAAFSSYIPMSQSSPVEHQWYSSYYPSGLGYTSVYTHPYAISTPAPPGYDYWYHRCVFLAEI